MLGGKSRRARNTHGEYHGNQHQTNRQQPPEQPTRCTHRYSLPHEAVYRTHSRRHADEREMDLTAAPISTQHSRRRRTARSSQDLAKRRYNLNTARQGRPCGPRAAAAALSPTGQTAPFHAEERCRLRDRFRRRATTAPRRGGSPIAAVANIEDPLSGLRFAQDQQAVTLLALSLLPARGPLSGGGHVVALGRHAEAGIVVGGLAALAMRRGMAVTVDATVPDPWRSEGSVAVAAEGWMMPEAVLQFGSETPSRFACCLYAHDITMRS